MKTNQTDILSRLSEVRNSLDSKKTKVERDKIGDLLGEINFIFEKKDDFYSQVADVFGAMGDFDFSKRLPVPENEINEYDSTLARGVNWLNEEFATTALHKSIVGTVFETIGIEDAMLVVTDSNGLIKVVNHGRTEFSNFNEAALLGQSVHVLFEDFRTIIDNRFKEGASLKNISINLLWNNRSIPVRLNIGFLTRCGKFEAAVYFIRLSGNHDAF